MNSFERVYVALDGRPVDRPPVFPQIGDHAGRIIGLPYNVMYEDAEKAAQAHLDAQKFYGYDIVTIQVEPSWPVAEACGAGVTYPPDKNPWITDYLVKTEDDLEKLHVPDFMATRSTRVMIEGTRILADRADVPTAAFMTGPMTFSLQLMPYNEVIKRIVKHPDFVHRLVSKTAEVIAAYARALREAGATILVMAEHDVQMMSPKHFKAFTLDYLPDLFKLYDYNMLHICGNVMPHLRANAEQISALARLNMINLSPEVDLAQARELLESKIGVAGNIDHVNLLPLSTPAEITATVHSVMRVFQDDSRFMVAPGCEITADTPVENVKAFVDAVASYGSKHGTP